MQVYDAIKSVDTLDAEKPWLMKLDLPVPQKCILEKEEVGGLRHGTLCNKLFLMELTGYNQEKFYRDSYDVISSDALGRFF